MGYGLSAGNICDAPHTLLVVSADFRTPAPRNRAIRSHNLELADPVECFINLCTRRPCKIYPQIELADVKSGLRKMAKKKRASRFGAKV
jgi:hypothetical protein